MESATIPAHPSDESAAHPSDESAARPSAESAAPPSDESAANASDESAQMRRKCRRFLILGIALSLGPMLGVLAMAFAMGVSFRRIQNARAPTPGDLSAGMWLVPLAGLAGMLLGIAGAGLVLWSYRKLRALEPEPDLLGPDSGPWR